MIQVGPWMRHDPGRAVDGRLLQGAATYAWVGSVGGGLPRICVVPLALLVPLEAEGPRVEVFDLG